MAFQPRDYSPSLIFSLKIPLKHLLLLREAHPRGEASYEPASTAQPIAPTNALRQQLLKSFLQFIPRLKHVGFLANYGKWALPKRKNVKRILVVTLYDGDWDEVKLLTDRGDRTLLSMGLKGDELAKLDHKIRVQRGRLKGYNKRIGHRLAFAREKKRVDEGYE